MVEDFLHSYLTCALFAEVNEHGVPYDQLFTIEDFSAAAKTAAALDCRHFLSVACEYELLSGDSCEDAGHDFWLTRNGHGTGFYDRPEIYGEEESTKLTLMSRCFGVVELHINTDGKIYFT